MISVRFSGEAGGRWRAREWRGGGMLLADRPPTSLELSTGTSSKVGPGSYTPQDFKPRAVCTAPFRSTARRVEPTAWQSVGPAAYNVPTSLGQNMRGGQSSFRGSARMCNSTSKDQLSTPGPGSYHVPSSWDSFQTATRSAKQLSSTTFEWCRRSAVLAIRADRLQMNVVGPCSYSPQYGTTSKDRCASRVKLPCYLVRYSVMGQVGRVAQNEGGVPQDLHEWGEGRVHRGYLHTSSWILLMRGHFTSQEIKMC